jgi:G3E family GTPase
VDVTRVSVVVADGRQQRQAAVDQWLSAHPSGVRAVVAEGAFEPLAVPENVLISQLTAGCVCCVGQVPLRVALVRMLRSARPRNLLLVVSGATHLERLRALLADGSLGVKLEVDP